ncbi:MAG TPA: GNAT family N-acetyltransferase, partial [Tepidisphaeraceae bacterium]|nr:GNAT family N-acetyltransferase [Tepidisphaeraceae bacterium]
MLIRPATPEDVPAVLPMVRQLCELHRAWDPAKYSFLDGIEKMYDGWLRARAKDDRAVFLVAEREGKGPVGFLIGTVEREIPIYKLAEYGFVHDLWVEPAYRNEGVARQLVMEAVERFTGIGVKQVRLDTAAPNEVARKLFERCGFRVSVVEMLVEVGSERRQGEGGPR